MIRHPRNPPLFPSTPLFRSHPRRFGIACHLGLLTGIPAIGVAKSLLVGTHTEPANERGAWQPLRSEEHTSELQSRQYLVCRLLLEKTIYQNVDAKPYTDPLA